MPLVQLSRIMHADFDEEVFEHGGEELKVGENDGIDPDLLTQLDLDEFHIGGAGREHVAILLLDQD